MKERYVLITMESNFNEIFIRFPKDKMEKPMI